VRQKSSGDHAGPQKNEQLKSLQDTPCNRKTRHAEGIRQRNEHSQGGGENTAKNVSEKTVFFKESEIRGKKQFNSRTGGKSVPFLWGALFRGEAAEAKRSNEGGNDGKEDRHP